MSTYYLNANSMVQNGTSPSTGWHNFFTLLNSVGLNDGDQVIFVDNGIIDDSQHQLSVSTTLTLSAYGSPVYVKPTWKLGNPDTISTSDSLVFHGGSTKILTASNLRVIADISYGEVASFQILDGALGSIFDSCEFVSAKVRIETGSFPVSLCDVVNCTFTNIPASSNDPGVICGGSHTSNICNNTFYLVPYGVALFGHANVNIYNNIFHSTWFEAVYTNVDGSSAVVADYNDSYNWGRSAPLPDPGVEYRSDGFYVVGNGGSSAIVIGAHNIRGLDPQLVGPSAGDFYPLNTSPCIDTGVDNSSLSFIPTHDIEQTVRPIGAHTDIGAYEFEPNAPVAQFTYVINGNTVTFTDISQNHPTSWLYDFGDFTQSTQQNPAHTYTTPPNSFIVYLIATNANGSNESPAVIINTNPGPTPPPYYYQFTVSYEGNGNTGGTAPVDSNIYMTGETVTTMTVGSLVKTNFIFRGWNTELDGSGTSYAQGASFSITSDTTLFAIWELVPSSFVVRLEGSGPILIAGRLLLNDGVLDMNGRDVQVGTFIIP